MDDDPNPRIWAPLFIIVPIAALVMLWLGFR